MSLEILKKLPFHVADTNLEVWLFWNGQTQEYIAQVRQDSAQLAFIYPDGKKARLTYTVTREMALDIRATNGSSAVDSIIESAKRDPLYMKFEEVSVDG